MHISRLNEPSRGQFPELDKLLEVHLIRDFGSANLIGSISRLLLVIVHSFIYKLQGVCVLIINVGFGHFSINHALKQ